MALRERGVVLSGFAQLEPGMLDKQSDSDELHAYAAKSFCPIRRWYVLKRNHAVWSLKDSTQRSSTVAHMCVSNNYAGVDCKRQKTR